MGTVGSKSPLERRNTVARRSQRRSLHDLKLKVEKLHKDVKKFKGISEDVNYVALKREIEYYKNDLMRRAKDLQPQIRTLYETVYKKLAETEEALQQKLEENREKQMKKQETSPTPARAERDSEALSDIMSHTSETVAEVHAEPSDEATQLENSTDKRKTVELNIIKVVPTDGSVVASPNYTEKRKSILKVGVPVMPGAIMNEMAAQSGRLTRNYEHKVVQIRDINSTIDDIVGGLRQLEEEISVFVGMKNGKQYAKMKNALNQYIVELNHLNPSDEHESEQIRNCRAYINSCITFLEEKATDARPESFTSDDEVFNNNVQLMTNVEANFKKQMLLKNTAV